MPRAYASQLQSFQQLLICVQVQFALLTSPPQGVGGGSELAAPGYARQNISLAATGVMCAANPAAITYAATGPWPTCEYFALYDLGGDFLYYGMLSPPVTTNGGTVTIPAGGAFVDWLNAAPNYSPDFGRMPVGQDPVAPIDSPTYVHQQMLALFDASSDSIQATDVISLRGTWCGSFAQQGLLGRCDMGTLLPLRMLDATRGTSTGYTVSVPNGLAF